MLKKMSALLAAGAMIFALGGCTTEQEGPAENVGKQIDEAAKEAGEVMEKAGEETQEKAEGEAPAE